MMSLREIPTTQCVALLGALALWFAPGCGGTTSSPSGSSGPVVLFGGGYLSDTWVRNGTKCQQSTATGPTGRSYAAAAGVNGSMLLFGGLNGPQQVLGDTWVWSGTAWTPSSATGPSP